MLSHFDSIVAPITGSSAAAVAIVRLSGPEAWSIASKVFDPWKPEHMRAAYGKLSSGDDGIALPFTHGHSYTGEEAVELSCHGSRAAVGELVAACIAAGARMAEPGEFTQRAFLNGRIDLTQAEAVRETIEASSSAQLRLANLHREGSLRRRVTDIRNAMFRVLAAIEATVDFSEEIGDLDRATATLDLQAQIGSIEQLLRTADTGRLIRQGLRIAIIGPPNAGKSSLLNALLKSDRALVTEIPGTTRDFVEEQIEVNGLPIVLIDTAGLRESDDRVESMGIQKSRAIAAAADLMWFVYDASVGLTDEDRRTSEGFQKLLYVANKIDLTREFLLPPNSTGISAATGEGIPALLDTIPDVELGAREFAISPRHSPPLQDARDAIEAAIAVLNADKPVDLATVFIGEALDRLGRITGETASEDMLHRIFSDFCIGK